MAAGPYFLSPQKFPKMELGHWHLKNRVKIHGYFLQFSTNFSIMHNGSSSKHFLRIPRKSSKHDLVFRPPLLKWPLSNHWSYVWKCLLASQIIIKKCKIFCRTILKQSFKVEKLKVEWIIAFELFRFRASP